MKKNIFFLLLILGLGASAVFKNNDPFPKTSYTNLQGTSITLPDSGKGRYTLVFVALNKSSLDSMMTWAGPGYVTFINPPQTNSVLVKTDYKINLYYIAATKGMPKNISGIIVDTLRRQNTNDLSANFLLYNEPVKKLSALLNISDPNTVQTYLLDYNGKIVYTSSGAYSVQKLNKLTDILADTK